MLTSLSMGGLGGSMDFAGWAILASAVDRATPVAPMQPVRTSIDRDAARAFWGNGIRLQTGTS